MRKKDHYQTLGVKRTADDRGIRTAFRQLAKRYHPDISGPDETRHFQEILEAYSVLIDPESRASYNRDLLERSAPDTVRVKSKRAETSENVAPVRSPRSPFFGTSVEQGPTSWMDEFFDFLFDDFAGWGPGSLRPRRRETFDVEVVLSRKEAGRGGVLPLSYPVPARCRFCGGTGLTGRSVCASCHGQGIVEKKETVRIRVPQGVRNGSVFEVVTNNPESPGVVLRVLILVAAG